MYPIQHTFLLLRFSRSLRFSFFNLHFNLDCYFSLLFLPVVPPAYKFSCVSRLSSVCVFPPYKNNWLLLLPLATTVQKGSRYVVISLFLHLPVHFLVICTLFVRACVLWLLNYYYCNYDNYDTLRQTKTSDTFAIIES